MFRSEPWAEAFTGIAGETAGETLEFLKLFCRAALSLPGELSGKNDADRLGVFIAAAVKTALPGGTASAETARRFLLLMIQKRRFHFHREIILKIEKIINRQRGLEEVIVESAAEPGGELLEIIQNRAIRLTGAREVRLSVRVIPGLIGGFRLRIGTSLFDASLKTQLQKMAADLSSVSGCSRTGVPGMEA